MYCSNNFNEKYWGIYCIKFSRPPMKQVPDYRETTGLRFRKKFFHIFKPTHVVKFEK